MITAKIETPEETYHIEPSWRHISDSEPETMIAYKESDINFRYKFTYSLKKFRISKF